MLHADAAEAEATDDDAVIAPVLTVATEPLSSAVVLELQLRVLLATAVAMLVLQAVLA